MVSKAYSRSPPSAPVNRAIETNSLIVSGKLKGVMKPREEGRKKQEGNLTGNSPDFRISSLQDT